MRRRLSRQGFLKVMAAAAIGLGAAQAGTFAYQKALPGQPRTPSRAACCYGPRALAEQRTPLATATATVTPTPTPIASSIQRPPEPTPTPVASSIQRPPDPRPPAATAPIAPALSPEAELVGEAQRLYGVRIVLDGQEWGDSLNVRLANIQAVIDAVARLPEGVRTAIVGGHPHGPIHILSNYHGRTLSGWQPYGDFPIGFYTNSDHDPGRGTVEASSQVVLIPGFADASIGHELLHAYQLRAVPPDRYGLAMLGQEMKSFIQAVGWVQIGSDDAVMQASQPDSAWADFNALFQYVGRELTYLTADGASYTLRPVNPLEAFAVAGSFYYTRPSSVALPDWPEYWAWFRANLG